MILESEKEKEKKSASHRRDAYIADIMHRITPDTDHASLMQCSELVISIIIHHLLSNSVSRYNCYPFLMF